jgi:signal peptidase II
VAPYFTGIFGKDRITVMQTRVGFTVIVLAVLVLDQMSKIAISSEMMLGQSVPVLPGLVHITLVHNTGMAFGILSAQTIPFKAVLVTLLSLAALTAVAIYALRTPARQTLTRWGLAFVLGGAAGNIIDRVRLGYVVDFIDVFFRSSHWPAFNLADTAICTGVGLLLLDTLMHSEPQQAISRASARES